MRYKILLVVIALVVLPFRTPADAVGVEQPQIPGLTPVSYESITIDNTAGGKAFAAATLSPTGVGQVRVCAGRLETAQVRFRVDGLGAVTTSEGTLLEVGDFLSIPGFTALSQWRAIRTGGSSGVIKFTCYR